mgnify:CR=1 FL=1
MARIVEEALEYRKYVVLSDLPTLPLPPHVFFSPMDVSMPDTAPEQSQMKSSDLSASWIPRSSFDRCNFIEPTFVELLEKNKTKPDGPNIVNNKITDAPPPRTPTKKSNPKSTEKHSSVPIADKPAATTAPPQSSPARVAKAPKKPTEISQLPTTDKKQQEPATSAPLHAPIVQKQPKKSTKPTVPQETASEIIKETSKVSKIAPKEKTQETKVSNETITPPSDHSPDFAPKSPPNRVNIEKKTASDIKPNQSSTTNSKASEESNKKQKAPPVVDYETQSRIAFVIPPTGGLQGSNELDDTAAQVRFEGRMPPRFSSLTAEEHVLYLEYLGKFRREQLDKHQNPGAMPRLNVGERQLFGQLQVKVNQETAEYQKWVLTDVQEHKEDYLIYPSTVRQTIERVIEEYRNRVLNYPRYYNTLTDHSIVLNSPQCQITPNDPILRHSHTIHNAGIVPVWKSPQNLPLAVPDAKELSIYPGRGEVSDEASKRWCKLRLPDISKDDIISDILCKAVSIPIDIVASSSTLQTLMDNIAPSYNKQWEIPVVIKSIKRVDQTSKKFVILDKPLVPHKLNLREKNTKYVRYASSHLSIDPKDSGVQTFPKTGGAGALVEEKLHETGQNLTYNTWNFGDLSLLIRCSIHGVIHDPKTPDKFRYVGVKAKMEYLQRGCEVVSPSESARWWIYTYLRPDAHLMVGHCNALTQQITEVEHLTMQDIHSSSSFKPEISSKMVYVLLKNLMALPEGEYLLSHKSGEPKIEILQALKPPKSFKDGAQEDMSDDELTIVDEDISDDEQSSNPPKESNSKPEEFSFSYDLYEHHRESGATCTDTIPFLMAKWTSETHIPYTFPVAPKSVTGKRKKTPKKPRARHCFSFLKKGTCASGASCPYPHLTASQVEELSRKMKNSPRRSKRQRRNSSTK